MNLRGVIPPAIQRYQCDVRTVVATASGARSSVLAKRKPSRSGRSAAGDRADALARREGGINGMQDDQHPPFELTWRAARQIHARPPLMHGCAQLEHHQAKEEGRADAGVSLRCATSSTAAASSA